MNIPMPVERVSYGTRQSTAMRRDANARTLEEIPNEQHAHRSRICRIHSPEHIERDDTDEHHREDLHDISELKCLEVELSYSPGKHMPA